MDKGKKWCCIPRIIPDFSFLSCRFNCKKSFLKFFVTLKCFIHVGKWWIYVVSLIQNAYFLNISEDSIFSCMKVFVTFYTVVLLIYWYSEHSLHILLPQQPSKYMITLGWRAIERLGKDKFKIMTNFPLFQNLT